MAARFLAIARNDSSFLESTLSSPTIPEALYLLYLVYLLYTVNTPNTL